jgi:AraC-type DNA-binding domain-containing proteins
MLFPLEQKRFDNTIFRFMVNNLGIDHENSKDFLDFVPKIGEKEQKQIVHDIFEKMLSTFLSPYYGATYHLQDLFFKLLEVLCNPDYYSSVHVTTKGNIESLLFARVDQLLEEYHGRISNRELSELLNYDGSYIGKVVKKYTGICLFDYSMTFTMKEAARLLKETDESITEIAEILYFTNRSHFYRIFEKFYHMTPKNYRRNNKLYNIY